MAIVRDRREPIGMRCDTQGCINSLSLRHKHCNAEAARRTAKRSGWAYRREYIGPPGYPKRMQWYRMLDLCPSCAKNEGAR